MRVSSREYGHLLATYLLPQGRMVATLALLLLGNIGLQLANPQLLRIFIDAVTGADRHTNLTAIAILFIAIALAQQLLLVGATYLGERVGWTATNALRADLTLHVLGLDLAYHKAHTPGELIERVDGDVTALANFFAQFMIQVVGNVLLLIGVLAVLWLQAWQAGLALSIFAFLVLSGMLAMRAIAVPYWTASRQASAELFGFLEERLAGAEDLRASGAREYVLHRLHGFLAARLRTGRRARVIGSFTWLVPLTLAMAGYLLAFGIAAFLYRQHRLTLGGAFLIYYYTQLLFQPIETIQNQIDDFQKASAGIVRIGELRATRGTIKDGIGNPLPDGPLVVELDHVSFGYGDEEMVLHDISFQLPPGQVLGLLGRTGSGKTTIGRLLLRLYDPAAGTVRLNGVDIRDLRRADLRRRIGIATQDVQLFGATVRANLTLFDPAIDDARIMAALEQLGLANWCNALSNGLDTMLAPGGSGLSAGESQLLAFARVFLRNPGLVILDEASSRLDPATERLIEGAVRALLAGRTGIIIAHRLSTIRHANTILILEQGRIREQGARLQLAADTQSRLAQLGAGSEELPA